MLLSAGRDPRTLEPLPGGRPGLTRLGYSVARDGYRRYFKRWLSPAALAKITETKEQALKIVGHDPVIAPDPLLPSLPLTLGGLLFSSIFNLGDRRKNHVDLLSAYLLAFQDREDVTLGDQARDQPDPRASRSQHLPAHVSFLAYPAQMPARADHGLS